MKFIYYTLDKSNTIIEHQVYEKYNPEEIEYMLQTLNIYYEIKTT